MVKLNAWGSDDPAEVDKGGTGVALTTAYAVMCGGTTTTGPVQFVASLGSSGDQLTSNGSALPTFETPAGGSGLWSFVSSQTISTDATIDFTGLAAGYDYQYIVQELVTDTDGVFLWLRVGTGATPTWIASSSYKATSGGAGTKIPVVRTGLGTSTNEALASEITVFRPGDASDYTRIFCNSGWIDSAGQESRAYEGGSYRAATAVTAIRFLASTGNLSTGTIREYRRSLS